MRKIFSVCCFIAALVLAASCAKDNTVPSLSTADETAQVYGVDLRFDAPVDLTEATVQFFDGNGQQVAVTNVNVPETSAEAVTATFLAESEPRYLYTDGLQHVNENGLMAIPRSSVQTRAGNDALLLVIRH